MTAQLVSAPCPAPPSAAEAALQAEIIAGFDNRHAACGHRTTTRSADQRFIAAFQAFVGAILWFWRRADMDRYGASLLAAGNARNTIRGKQSAIRRFLAFARDPAYDWDERGYALTGKHIPQVCTLENTIVHHFGAATSARRTMTSDELRRIFGAARHRIENACRRDHKLAYQMHYAVLSLGLAVGGREHELEMADTVDLHRAVTPEIVAYSPFEDFEIRFGKAYNGGEPKRRTVVATAQFQNQFAAVNWYLREVRPKLARGHSGDALFLSCTGNRFRGDSMSAIFADLRDEAGISSDLTFHCLRHTFETRLHESGLEIGIISVLMGHADERTTVLYDHMGRDFIKRRVLASNRRIIATSQMSRLSTGLYAH